MYILAIYHNGKTYGFASHKARLLKPVVPRLFKDLFKQGDTWAWRAYRAGDGWYEGSGDAWRFIDSPPRQVQAVLFESEFDT